MVYVKSPLSAGLYLVATPIGAARDITLHALDIFASADILAAEDTRSLRRLLEIHGVPLEGRRVVAYHDHSKPAQRRRLLDEIAAGRSVAYAPEAGTPLLADPGFVLAREARAEGLAVHAAPGASALLTALCVGGMASDRVFFAGFLPPQKTARRKALEELGQTRATLALYESPGRIRETLADCVQVFGGTREAALCRELTKRFEEVRQGSLADLAEGAVTDPPRGEIVLLIARAEDVAPDEDVIRAALAEALQHARVKDAASDVAARLGIPRRDAYQLALEMEKAGRT